MKKKHAPIEQLREVGKYAHEKLMKMGVIGDDVIKKIEDDPSAPKLPGIPSYLPQSWTLKASQRMMYDMLRDWQLCTKNEEDQESIGDFSKFVIKRIKEIEKKSKKQVKDLGTKLNKGIRKKKTIEEVFSPIQVLETCIAMNKFFIDSFAIAVLLKNYDSTSQYAEWFLTWTEELHTLWTGTIVKKLTTDA